MSVDVNQNRFIWINGEILGWDKACIHVNTHCVLGGLNVYEVVQAHYNKSIRDLYLFRIDEHLKRLKNSCKIMRISFPYTIDEFLDAFKEIIAINNFEEDILIRLVVYLGEGPLFAYEKAEIDVGAFIMPFSAKATVPDGKNGLNCCTTSWFRASDNTVPPRVKAGANYQNVRLAYIQARVNGYDAPVLLNASGKVTESHLRNIFIVRGSSVFTPSANSGILEGVVRQSLLEIIPKELGLTVHETEIDKTELYTADELFLSGTAIDEVIPILSIDGYLIGSGAPGELTKRIQSIFRDIAHGDVQHYNNWLTSVYRSS